MSKPILNYLQYLGHNNHHIPHQCQKTVIITIIIFNILVTTIIVKLIARNTIIIFISHLSTVVSSPSSSTCSSTSPLRWTRSPTLSWSLTLTMMEQSQLRWSWDGLIMIESSVCLIVIKFSEILKHKKWNEIIKHSKLDFCEGQLQ